MFWFHFFMLRILVKPYMNTYRKARRRAYPRWEQQLVRTLWRVLV